MKKQLQSQSKLNSKILSDFLNKINLKHEILNTSELDGAFFSIRLSDDRKKFVLGIDDNNIALKISYSYDSKFKQAVLTVIEPPRNVEYKFDKTFSEIEYTYLVSKNYSLEAVKKVTRLNFNTNIYPYYEYLGKVKKRHTLSFKRITKITTTTEMCFLIGVDESHYFISQLPKVVKTVKEAHTLLRPKNVPINSLRQGEWFFVEFKDLGSISKKKNVFFDDFEFNMKLDETDHIAQLGLNLFVDSKSDPQSLYLVSGKIVNPRHKTIDLGNKLYLAIRNTEVRNKDNIWD